MGFFSWKTSDTGESIPSRYSCRPTFTVHMITEDGQIFTEKDYEGYGEFGDKDIYELIAEMNNLSDGDLELRSVAINEMYKTYLTSPDGKKTYKPGRSSDADFFHWDSPLPQEGGKTPNQLQREGWSQFYPNGYGDWNKAAQNGMKLPKLVRELPVNQDWKEFWDSLPYPEDCEHQGFFYPEEDEEENEY